MRRLLPVVALATLFASPALAQDFTAEQIEAATSSIAAMELSDESQQDLWCGAAFGIVQDMLTASGDTATAEQLGAKKDFLFEKAGGELLAAGMTEADLTSLGSSYYIVALSQTKASDGAADYTQDECLAAAEPKAE